MKILSTVNQTSDKCRDEQESQVENRQDEHLPSTSISCDLSGALAAEFKVSRRRWAVVVAITIFGFLNGITNELSPILDTLVKLMGTTIEKYVYIRTLSNITPLLAVPVAWYINNYGIKVSIYTAVFFTIIRNGARSMLFLPDSPHWMEFRYAYLISFGIAECVVAILYYCSLLDVSESWFPERERSISWTMMLVGPVLGSALIALILPHYVKGVTTIVPLAYLNLISLAITVLAIGLGVQRSKPKHPPSERNRRAAQADHQSLVQNVRNLLCNRGAMLQILTSSVYDAANNAITSALQDVLASSGFSSVSCGIFVASKTLAAGLSQLAGSFLVKDNTGQKGNTYICKCYLFFQWIAFILYCTSLCLKGFPMQWWLVIGFAIAHYLIRYWASPSYNNMLASLIAGSTTGATTSAAWSIMDNGLTIIFSILFVALRQVSSEDSHQASYLHSISFLIASTSIVSLLYLTFFSGRRKEDTIQDTEVLVDDSISIASS